MIAFERRRGAALCFHVLAHLDLGRDAASLFDRSLPRRPWVDGLRDAYAAASGRLAVHAVGLVCVDPVVLLRGDPPGMLRDAAGRELATRLADAMETESSRYEPVFADVPAEIVEPLGILRAALYERVGAPPPLTLLDCPSLRKAGRATVHRDSRVIAVSLGQDPGHVLCQTIHEEIHGVTDPVVRREFAVGQDTRENSPGFALHRALEHAAIEVGEALIAARAPAWLPAYAHWRPDPDRRPNPAAPGRTVS